MKTLKRKLILISVHSSLLVILLAFQNCAKVTMTTDPLAASSSSSDPTIYICSPFEKAAKTNSNSGIKTELRYISSTSNLSDADKLNIPSKQYFDNSPSFVRVPETLYLSEINIPSRRFENGFSTSDGNQLRDAQGNLLVEYFALRMESILQLGPNDPEGFYELGIVSDDGSVLQFQENGQWVDFINNDGAHSAQLGCMNRRIHLSRNSRIPFRLYYNQAARFEIANVLIWNYRGTDPVATPAGASTDSEIRSYCGRASNESYWNPMTSSEGPWIQDMWNRGWKPLNGDNFLLPNNETNPCAAQNP